MYLPLSTDFKISGNEDPYSKTETPIKHEASIKPEKFGLQGNKLKNWIESLSTRHSQISGLSMDELGMKYHVIAGEGKGRGE